MARLTAAAVALSALVSLGDALSFPGARTGDGFVHVPVAKRAPLAPAANGLRRRATSNTATLDMANAQIYGYMVNISLGSPGQNTLVSLDTGSTELWVNPKCSNGDLFVAPGLSTNGVPNPESEKNYCDSVSRYTKSKSSTAKTPDVKSTTFTYADGAFADIDYVQDTLKISGVSVTEQVFGVASNSNFTSTGILGIGPWFEGFDAPASQTGYDLLLTNMAKQGHIKSRAFSLDLHDFDNTTGSLIFGGVDRAKYSGDLWQLPIQNQSFTVQGQKVLDVAYWLKVTSYSVTKPGETKASSLPMPSGGKSLLAGLDCGSSALLLPSDAAKDICTAAGGSFASGGCSTTADMCKLRDQTGGVTFGFGGGASVMATWSNLIEPITQGDGSTACSLAVVASTVDSSPATYLLGAPFLRSVYAVFDWDNQNIHLAQAANCGEDVVAIGTGSKSVPSGKGKCDAASPSSKSSSGVGALAPNTGVLLAAVLGSGLLAMMQ